MSKSKYLSVFVILGLLLRLFVSSISYGSNDMRNWESFSHAASFCALYSLPFFNNPPIPGLWAITLHRIFAESMWVFPLLFKLPGILCDVGTIVLVSVLTNRLSKKASIFATGVMSISIPSILVSSFHGNTDSVCIFLALLSVFLFERQKWFFSGTTLAAALNIKIIPVLLIFPLISRLYSRRSAGHFALGLALATIPFFLAFQLCGSASLKSVFHYDSNPEEWGILGALALAARQLPSISKDLLTLGMNYHHYGKWLLLALTVALPVMARNQRDEKSLLSLTAISMSLFLVLGSGFGLQYLAYPIPFLLCNPSTFVVLYLVLSSSYLVLVYNHFLTPDVLFTTHHVGQIPTYFTSLGILVWTVLIICMFERARPLFKTSSSPKSKVV